MHPTKLLFAGCSVRLLPEQRKRDLHALGGRRATIGAYTSCQRCCAATLRVRQDERSKAHPASPHHPRTTGRALQKINGRYRSDWTCLTTYGNKTQRFKNYNRKKKMRE